MRERGGQQEIHHNISEFNGEKFFTGPIRERNLLFALGVAGIIVVGAVLKSNSGGGDSNDNPSRSNGGITNLGQPEKYLDCDQAKQAAMRWVSDSGLERKGYTVKDIEYDSGHTELEIYDEKGRYVGRSIALITDDKENMRKPVIAWL